MYSVYEGLFLRCFGLMAVIPFGEGVSLVKKLMIAAVLTILFASQVTPGQVTSIGTEVLLGMLIGIPAAIAVGAVEMWGDMSDNLRGQNQGSMNDPLFGTTSLLGGLLRHYSFALLLVAGLLNILLGGLHSSLAAFPVGSIKFAAIADSGALLLSALSKMLDATIVALVPVAVACVIVEILSGVFGKILPKISLSSEAFQIRSILVILIIFGLTRLELVSTLLSAATSGTTVLDQVLTPTGG